MTKFAISLVAAMLLTACATPSMLVYSNGFSFANYDYIVVVKPNGLNSGTSLYGMDVEFANVMSRYNMKVLGDKELESLSPEVRKRALFARLSMEASNRRILMSVSFDDAVTGKTQSSITTYTKGRIFDADDRSKAFDSASRSIESALQNDKGLKISESKKVARS